MRSLEFSGGGGNGSGGGSGTGNQLLFMLEQTSLRARAIATVVTALAYSMSTDDQHPRDVAQLADARQALNGSLGPLDVTELAELREARDGNAYTAIEFQQHYGVRWGTFWDAARTREAQPRVLEGSVSQFASEVWLGQREAQPQVGEGGAPQPAAAIGVVEVRLDPAMVVGIRQQEAARGPPRSLHRMARDALNQISQNPTYESQNLDEVFDWVPYVAAHVHSDEIIGPGITHAMAHFDHGTRDRNRGGAPRLDFYFYRTDQTVCRVHPGRRPKEDVELIFE